MKPLLHEPFPRSWRADVLERPPLIAPARQFVYPHNVAGEEDTLARGAVLVQVKPREGGTFLATCALGYTDDSLPGGVWTCPDADTMLVLAGGYAYLANTLTPERCEHLPLRPVTAVLAAARDGLILLAGFHHVLAVGAKGVAWTSARLSWEGVTLGDVRDGKLHGTGWNMMDDREYPFEVDLRDGSHTGGGFAR